MQIELSAAFASTSSLPSPCGELSSLSGFGANDAELAVDDTEAEGTIIARRINQATEAGGGAEAETGAGKPVPVHGPNL